MILFNTVLYETKLVIIWSAKDIGVLRLFGGSVSGFKGNLGPSIP